MNKRHPVGYLLCFVFLMSFFQGISQEIKYPVVTPHEDKPSKSIYFDWININWYGGNETKVLSNLQFFKWLHQEYGLKLDIYLLDAGNIDNGPVCNVCEDGLKNVPRYGGIDSEWFKNKYPSGLDTIVNMAKSFGCKIGLWIGPDGYGDNDSIAQSRIKMLDDLTSRYGVALLKMDLCCSDLDPKNEKYFIRAMQKCFENNPELIVLNHRIKMSDEARKYTTTFLWEGAETYIDVSLCNNKPSPHHRVTLERGLPPDLNRLTEDHGVCLSSCLDYWEDDLVLQAFNRSLILAPEIYGNPWLLKDSEFSTLARIFNLHAQYNNILTKGMILHEETYGKNAVSRGDEHTRIITLRNLSWQSKKYMLTINQSIGLSHASKFEVRQYHPSECIIGNYNYGQKVEIEVLPFRSCLLKVSSELAETGIEGCNYQIVKNTKDGVEIDLLAFPGEKKTIKLIGEHSNFKMAKIDGTDANKLLTQESFDISFKGTRLKSSFYRFIGELNETSIPKETNTFIESIFFAASNNCLEAQSLKRSGTTETEAVQKARDAFFHDQVFIKIGAWDKFAFDNNPATSFNVRQYCNRIKPGLLRITLPASIIMQEIKIEGVEPDYKPIEAWVSNDLKIWKKTQIICSNREIILKIEGKQPVQFVKLNPAPLMVAEIKAYTDNQPIDISQSQLSNLFPDMKGTEVKKAWKNKFVLHELTKNSTLAVAIEGNYGEDNAYAAIEIDGKLINAFDRSPVFPFNNWEDKKSAQSGNYTYYFKIPEKQAKREVSVYVLGINNVEKIATPKVWLTVYPIPFERKRLVIN